AAETDDGTGWRTRVSLHVDAEGRIGPYAARSHRVIEVDELPLATPEIADAARALRESGPHRSPDPLRSAGPHRSPSLSRGRIDLVQPADGRVRILIRPADRDPRRQGRRAEGVISPHKGSSRRQRGHLGEQE